MKSPSCPFDPENQKHGERKKAANPLVYVSLINK